ncbi:MAG: gliding motility lipoprotein GldH [bacterium]
MHPNIRISLFVIQLAVAWSLCSCLDNRVFDESMRIEKGVWKADNIASFSVVITDTIALYDFYVDVRNDISYKFSNLYLFLRTDFPDGRVTRDTIECILATYEGKWLGSGIGSVRSSRFLFQKGMRFKIPGTYWFAFEQAMRVPDLEGIRDFGIRIDKE